MSVRILFGSACTALVLLAFVGPVSAAPSGTVTFGIQAAGSPDDQRTALSYSLSPGASAADRIAVVNYSAQPLDLRVYGADATTSADGGFVAQPAAARPTRVGSWLRIAGGTSKTVRVPAQAATPDGGTAPGRVELPVSLDVPTGAAGGDVAGAIVVALGSTATGSGQTMGFDQGLALRVYVKVTGAETPVSAGPAAVVRQGEHTASRPWLLPAVLIAVGVLLILVVWLVRRLRYGGGKPHGSSDRQPDAASSSDRRDAGGDRGRHRTRT